MIDNDFIGIFDNVVDEAYCKKVIQHFESVKTIHRSAHENVSHLQKDTEMYFLATETDSTIIDFNQQILEDFMKGLNIALAKYKKQYPILINGIKKYDLNNDVKIQRTLPGQGYHIWHCESSSLATARRMILVFLYLNDCKEGGETEFLYQHKRISPKTGRLILAPTGWTHTHRGNPPLKEPKYIINGWLEYQI